MILHLKWARPRVAVTLALIATTMLGSLGPAGLLRADEPATRPPAGAQLVAQAPPTGRLNLPAFGMTVVNYNSDTARRAKAAGASSVLVGMPWRLIQPTEGGAYDWSILDDKVATAVAAGLEPFMLFTGNPAWAYSGQYKVLNAAGRSGLALLAAAAAQRYETLYPGKVRLWSFFNEPDCNGPTTSPPLLPIRESDSSCYGDFGGEYTKMLQAVYPAIKAANPNALVVVGGLGYDDWRGPESFSEKFLDDLLASGGGNYFDIMNFHYYVEYASKWDPYGKDVIGKTAYIQGVMAKYCVRRPIILTEIAKQGVAGEDAQADYLVQGLTRAFAGGNDLTIWYELADASDSDYKFGLIRSDGTIKPAYTAYQLLSQKLSGIASTGIAIHNLAGVEAYRFTAPGGLTEEIVAWSADATTRVVRIPADRLVRNTRTGATTTINDGDDGLIDRQVSVSIGASPVILDVVWTSAPPVTGQPNKVFMPAIGRSMCDAGPPPIRPVSHGEYLPIIGRSMRD